MFLNNLLLPVGFLATARKKNIPALKTTSKGVGRFSYS